MASLNKEEALADAKVGMPINDIALKQGVTYQAVWRWLKTQKFKVTESEPEENGEEEPDTDEDDSGEDLQISGSTYTKKHNVAISHLIRCPKCNGKLERTRIRDEMGDITGIIYQCQDCEACFDV